MYITEKKNNELTRRENITQIYMAKDKENELYEGDEVIKSSSEK